MGTTIDGANRTHASGFKSSARPWPLVVLLTSLLLGSAPVALAGNWGAGINNDNWNCLARGDTAPDEYKSECTTEDLNWYVYIHPLVPDWWEQELIDSVHQDYEMGSEFQAHYVLQFSDTVDTGVYVLSVPNQWPYGIYTTCENHTDQAGGSGEYRWCDEQWLVIDDDHPWVVSENIASSPAKQRYLACHELGHTTGLQHPADLFATRVTCLDYDGDEVLHDHEKEHLRDCYPRPSPAPTNRTTACRVS